MTDLADARRAALNDAHLTRCRCGSWRWDNVECPACPAVQAYLDTTPPPRDSDEAWTALARQAALENLRWQHRAIRDQYRRQQASRRAQAGDDTITRCLCGGYLYAKQGRTRCPTCTALTRLCPCGALTDPDGTCPACIDRATELLAAPRHLRAVS